MSENSHDTPQRLVEKIDKALQHVFDIAAGRQRWTMRVPALPGEDSDCVLADALKEARDYIQSEIAPTQADLNSEYCRGREEGYEAGMLFEQQRQVRSVTQQIPDGWRLVPEEATDEMMEHFAGTPMCSLPHSRRAKERRAYRDMLDVTPIAPSGLPPSAKTLRKD